jgi:hypothetical protein
MGTGLGLGIGIPFRRMGGGIDAQAQAHYDRVIADGGLIPSGLVGVNNFFKTVKGIYGTSDITTAISVGLDAQVLGYKLGAGAGTTAGQAAQKLYSCSGASGDVEQTTAASQPLLLVHSGANYWFTSGVNGNNCIASGTDSTITGDIEVIAKININDIASGTYQTIISKYGQYMLEYFGSNGLFYFYYELSGGVTNASTTVTLASMGISSKQDFYLKVNRTQSNGNVNYYISTDGINYTQMGATISNVSGAIVNSNIDVLIGTRSTFNNFTGKIYRVTVAKSIGGAPVVDFNPSQYNAANSQTQWVSTSGETWTINTGTAATGYKGALVSKTIVQGDGVSAYMEQSGSLGFALNSANSFYFATRKYTTSNQFPFEYRKASASNGILARISTIYSNYRIGQDYQATSFTNNTLLNLFNSVFQANVNRSASVNNATPETDATAGTLSSDIVDNIGLFGFGAGSGANYNGTINNFIITKLADTTIQQTSMYNYIRSINGNSF